jgi:hypothetical protein
MFLQRRLWAGRESHTAGLKQLGQLLVVGVDEVGRLLPVVVLGLPAAPRRQQEAGGETETVSQAAVQLVLRRMCLTL